MEGVNKNPKDIVILSILLHQEGNRIILNWGEVTAERKGDVKEDFNIYFYEYLCHRKYQIM